MQRCVSFGAITEYKTFEEHALKNGADDKREVNESARGRSPTDGGGREDERGEDDPEADGEEQEGALGNQEEDGRRPNPKLVELWLEEGEHGVGRREGS